MSKKTRLITVIIAVDQPEQLRLPALQGWHLAGQNVCKTIII
jgi:hypothetical protein